MRTIFLPGGGAGSRSPEMSANRLSRPNAAWQRIGDALSRRWWFLESETLRASSQRRTRLEDFGHPPLQPAFPVLVQSLEAEADLHPLGRFLMRTHLLGLLETRLRLVHLWNAQPEVFQETPIRQPLFIIGMPRSGSTFLHELLAQDPENRVPQVWEVMFPVPGPGGWRQSREVRRRRAGACLWWFRRLAPEADSVYPMRADTPHECVAIHSYTFLSPEFVSTCRIPSYEAFLRRSDLGPAYLWEKRFLQHLQWGSPPRRWVLKAPDHVFGLAELFAVFPDARVIHTHRNPLDVLASSVELSRVLHGLYAWPGDGAQLRAREAQLLAEGTERSLRFRDLNSELAGRFVDVKYSELVAEPLAVIGRVYRQLGIPLTELAASRMRMLAASRTRYRRPRAAVKPGWLKSEFAAEAARFERYCARFDLSCRPVKLE